MHHAFFGTSWLMIEKDATSCDAGGEAGTMRLHGTFTPPDDTTSISTTSLETLKKAKAVRYGRRRILNWFLVDHNFTCVQREGDCLACEVRFHDKGRVHADDPQMVRPFQSRQLSARL